MRHEAVDLDRPNLVARLACHFVQDIRAFVQRTAELLEEHRGIEEREVLSIQDPDPPEFGELLHRRRRVRLEERARLATKVVLL